MLSLAQNLALQTDSWQLIELWIDPIVFPPRILMLVGSQEGNCCIYDATANYKPLFESPNYDEANSWLVEDDYERVDGRLLAEEIF
ncbi:MAG: hypothetical protein F6K35_39475 [Okeania sp. SIO2H7]|nr:hypothetical protein [Okeania sp. SIO2H7]